MNHFQNHNKFLVYNIKENKKFNKDEINISMDSINALKQNPLGNKLKKDKHFTNIIYTKNFPNSQKNNNYDILNSGNTYTDEGDRNKSKINNINPLHIGIPDKKYFKN